MCVLALRASPLERHVANGEGRLGERERRRRGGREVREQLDERVDEGRRVGRRRVQRAEAPPQRATLGAMLPSDAGSGVSSTRCSAPGVPSALAQCRRATRCAHAARVGGVGARAAPSKKELRGSGSFERERQERERRHRHKEEELDEFSSSPPREPKTPPTSMFAPTSRGARRAVALPGARRAISSSSLFSPIREFFRYENWLRGSALQERFRRSALSSTSSSAARQHVARRQTRVARRGARRRADGLRRAARSASASARWRRRCVCWRAGAGCSRRRRHSRRRSRRLRRRRRSRRRRRAARGAAAGGVRLRAGRRRVGRGRGRARGVFLRGGVAPGSVLALYPGVAMTPYDLLTMPGGTARFKDNEYLMARFDGAVIDASADGLAKLPHEGADCPLAVGHLFNHPPADVAPSVVPCAVDFDADVPHDLVPCCPTCTTWQQSEQQLLGFEPAAIAARRRRDARTDGITQQSSSSATAPNARGATPPPSSCRPRSPT